MPFRSVLANNILANPFDDKAQMSAAVKDKLTENVFFDECYCKAEFEIRKDLLDQDEDSPDSWTEEAKKVLPEREDAVTTLDNLESDADIINRVKLQKSDADRFDAWLKDSKVTDIYMICGSSGCGKTTYINWKRHNAPANQDWNIIDVSADGNYVEWDGDCKTFLTTDSPAARIFLLAILKEIRNIVFLQDTESIIQTQSKRAEEIKKIIQLYNKEFQDRPAYGKKLFRKLSNIQKEYTDSEEFVEKCAETFFEQFKNQDEQNIEQTLSFAVTILCVLKKCLGHTDQVWAFDNVERFISDQEIFNKDLCRIIRFLKQQSNSINDRFKNAVFRFIICMRNTTKEMLGEDTNSTDATSHVLNISQWFDPGLIVSQRQKWLKNNVSINNRDFDLVSKILQDQRTMPDGNLTGLKLIVDPLFNLNKRLQIDFIGRYLIEDEKKKDYLNLYEKLLETEGSIFKFAARSIIRGLLMKALEENDNLFEHLQHYSRKEKDETGNTDEIGQGIGLARKFVTILYNKYDNNLSSNYEPLRSVLETLFDTHNLDDYWKEENIRTNKARADEKNRLITIIYFMNSCNQRNNDWIQLIDLQYKGKDTNISLESEGDLKDLIEGELDQVTVSMLPAGMVYLEQMVPSFEFFSMRYSKNYIPLFACVPTRKQMQQEYLNISKLDCYKIIHNTKRYALKCLDILNQNDNIQIYLKKKKNTGLFHKTRIIRAHTGYLKLFLDILNAQIPEDEYGHMSTIETSNRDALIKDILNVINSYNRKMDT